LEIKQIKLNLSEKKLSGKYEVYISNCPPPPQKKVLPLLILLYSLNSIKSTAGALGKRELLLFSRVDVKCSVEEQFFMCRALPLNYINHIFTAPAGT
jgi:hypothetical protein